MPQEIGEYTVPKVWEAPAAEGKFASINKPTAGAQREEPLKKGEHQLQLYSMATPNGVKVTLMLEELCDLHPELEYDAWPVSIMQGDQFTSGFVESNPNSKIPTMMDHSTSPPTRVFESASILFHLSEKYNNAFFPREHKTEITNWVFWQMGSAPYLGGGFGHFFAYAPVKIEYAINRFTMETKRQLDVLDQQLATRKFIACDEYTIADMAIWPWYGNLVLGRLYEAAEFIEASSYKNVMRWAQEIDARPATKRGRMVNKSWGDEGQLPERHSRKDFEGKL
jgi:GST-like protein